MNWDLDAGIAVHREVETSEAMKPVTLKQPAVGHAKSYEACPPRSGNLTGGDVYDSKAANNQSRLGLVGLDDKLGVLHLEYRATGYRDFETSAMSEVFAQWNLLISGSDGTTSPRTDSARRFELKQNHRYFR